MPHVLVNKSTGLSEIKVTNITRRAALSSLAQIAILWQNRELGLLALIARVCIYAGRRDAL
jgi:hypothetical protein